MCFCFCHSFDENHLIAQTLSLRREQMNVFLENIYFYRDPMQRIAAFIRSIRNIEEISGLGTL